MLILPQLFSMSGALNYFIYICIPILYNFFLALRISIDIFVVSIGLLTTNSPHFFSSENVFISPLFFKIFSLSIEFWFSRIYFCSVSFLVNFVFSFAV